MGAEIDESKIFGGVNCDLALMSGAGGVLDVGEIARKISIVYRSKIKNLESIL